MDSSLQSLENENGQLIMGRVSTRVEEISRVYCPFSINKLSLIELKFDTQSKFDPQ